MTSRSRSVNTGSSSACSPATSALTIAALRPSNADPPLRHGADDPHELDDVDLLEHIRLGPASERLIEQILVEEGRQDHDVRLRAALDDLAAQLEALGVVVGAQLEVEQHDVRFGSVERAQRLAPAAGLGHHRDIGLELEDRAQASSDDRVIVDEHHPRGRRERLR